MFKRILVPVDGSTPYRKALSTACALARERGAELRLVHVLDQGATGYDTAGGAAGQLLQSMQDASRRMLQEFATLAREGGVPSADTVLLDGMGAGGRLGETIAEAARSWGADLVVVGTHGRRGPAACCLAAVPGDHPARAGPGAGHARTCRSVRRTTDRCARAKMGA